MSAKKDSLGTEAVLEFIKATSHPLKKEIAALREIILGAQKSFDEHIKWNAPSFLFNGEDRITLNLSSPKKIQLVFHRGAKAKQVPKNRLIDDPEDLLRWATNDRAVAAFENMRSITESKKYLAGLIKAWVAAAS